MEKIHDVPMIGHCYLRTKLAPELFETYVATCDQVIFDYIESIGGNAIMTSSSHERACDRAAEAMLEVERQIRAKVDIVVMVQGDEPMIMPQMISDSIKPLMVDESVNIVNLMSKIGTSEEFEDPNEVKVVIDKFSNAIYFSREPIPSRKKGIKDVPMLKQVCVIPFRRDYLLKFNETAETPLENIESVDMMRIIENGESIRMVMSNFESYSVDTLADLQNVQKKMINDKLMLEYN